jgi:exopolysaccharide/PEP-CTERM locus tyrosine autokinase
MSIIEKAVDRLEARDPRERTPLFERPEVAPTPLREEPLLDVGGALPPEPSPAQNVPVEPARRAREVQLTLEVLKAAGMLMPTDSESQLAEECRLIKRPLLVNAFGEVAAATPRRNLLMVTSSLPGEGKTFVSLSLAMSMAAEMERTVLLIDGDVIRGSVSALLGLDQEAGLTDVLAAEGRDVADVLLRTDIPKLTVIPSGHQYPNSTELLASDAMGRLADEVSSRYSDRIVIFDSPPLLAASGATVLARAVGQILLVVEAEKTSQKALKESLRVLKGLPLSGVLLNKARQRFWARYGYSYGYGYGYGYGYRYGYRKQTDPKPA